MGQHSLLQLPYSIWSSLSSIGLIWDRNLSPTDTPYAMEYRVLVHRVLKHSQPKIELLFSHDGEQYRCIESKGLPNYLRKSLDWRLGIEKAMITQLND